MTDQAPPREPFWWLRASAWLVASAIGILGFHVIAGTASELLIPQDGVQVIRETELAFYAWYCAFGVLCALLVCGAASELGVGPRLVALCTRLGERPERCVLAASAAMFVGSLVFRLLALDRQAITDDEATYVFIARTLLAGRLLNPPPEEPDFFRNQFVVLNDHAWYGKYPIGHPLWLALGEALHLRDVMGPLAGALCVALTYQVGCRFGSRQRAALGAVLLCASPHFVATCATLLSQPTSCLALLLGCWLLLRAQERTSVLDAALAGAVFGFGILVRPLPGVLFAAVGGMVFVAFAVRTQRSAWSERWLALALFSAAGLAVAGLLLLVNHAQTGGYLRTGYHEVHPNMALFGTAQTIANSLFGALLRENFWLLGVPLSLLPLVFWRAERQRALWLGLLCTTVAYRVIAPKTMVCSTGPVYLTEIVPLLTLAVADSLCRSAPLARTAQLSAAGLTVAAALFWPVQMQTLRTGVEARGLVYEGLAHSQADRGLVFADALVYPPTNVTWAYFPDNPSPDLNDRFVFVRIPKADSLRQMQNFWKRRFPDRRAFVFTWGPNGEPLFRELPEHD